MSEHYIPEASGHYFTEHLPDEWNTWESEELDKWCEDNAWEPFEYHDTNWVFEQAWNLAVRIHTCVEKATESLEHAVAECEVEIDNLRGRLLNMAKELEVGKSYTTEEILEMFPVEDGNIYVGFPELEGER